VATLELRPRSATEIIDGALQLMRAHYSTLVVISLAAQIPALVLQLGVLMAAPKLRDPSGDIFTWIAVGLAAFLVFVVLALLFQSAVTVVTSQVYLGDADDAGAALRRSWSRMGYLVLTGIVITLIALVAVAPAFFLPRTVGVVYGVALFFVAIYAGFRIAVLNTVVLLEDGGAITSIQRAWALGRGQFWHNLATLGLGIIIYIGVMLCALFIAAVIAGIATAFKAPAVSPVIQAILTALVYPLLIAISVMLYYDLRIRQEGFDVEMMSRSVPR
jgi:hypothetical protein